MKLYKGMESSDTKYASEKMKQPQSLYEIEEHMIQYHYLKYTFIVSRSKQT